MIILYFCPNSNQILTKKGVLYIFIYIFAFSLTKALPKRVFLSLFCPYSYQGLATKGVFLSIFALILTKPCHIPCSTLFLPLFQPKPAKNVFLTAKLLKQGYRYHNIRKAFSKFYYRHSELIVKYNIGLKTLLSATRHIRTYILW